MTTRGRGRWRYAVFKRWAAVLFLPLFIALALPLEIYLGNTKEIIFPFFSLLPILFAAFAGLLLVLALPLLSPWRRINSGYHSLLVAVSLLAWVNASFVRGDYGLFNGEELDLDSTGPVALLELAGWLGVIAFALVNQRFVALLGDLLVPVFLLTALVAGYNFSQAMRDRQLLAKQQFLDITVEQIDREKFAGVSDFSSQKNIIHIILDELQAQVFEELLRRQPELVPQLDGFTYYPDTTSIYPFTEISLPGILSGDIYRNGRELGTYLQQAFRDNRLFDALDAHGYTRSFHIYPSFCQDTYLDACTPTPGMAVRPVALTLLDFSLFRAVPTALKAQVYGPSGGVFKRVFGSGGYNDHMAGVAVLMFEEFNENIAVRDIPSSYKLFHSMISHAPVQLDGDCRILPEVKPNRLGPLAAQAGCALLQVRRFLLRLHELEIYDSTLIVVSSDHGGNYQDSKIKRRLKRLGIPPRHFSRAQAFLMIKPFDARGELKTSARRMSLADIAAIIGEEADLGPLPQEMGLPADPGRLREYFFMYWGMTEPTRDGRLVDFTHYCLGGPVRDPASWGRMAQRGDERHCEFPSPGEPP